MKTPEEYLIQRFPNAKDLDWFYPVVVCMKEYADQFKNPPKKTIEERKWQFGKDLDEVIGQPHCYSQVTIDFFDYWTEHGPNDKKMRHEKERSFDIKKRLERWKRNQKPNYGKSEPVDRDQQLADYINRPR